MKFFKSWPNCALSLLMVIALAAGITQARKRQNVPSDPPVPATWLSATTVGGTSTTEASNNSPVEAQESKPADTGIAPSVRASGTMTSAPPSTAMTDLERHVRSVYDSLVSTSGTSSTGVMPGTPRLAGISPARTGPAISSSFRMPLAFVPVNPNAATPAVETKIAQLQEQFVQAIGDTQNPTDPVFQNRWLTAQIQADMQYRAFFGQMAFQEMQLQQAQSANQ
jgi:hypothetical protein